MEITTQTGMVSIDTENLVYSNIRKMYKHGDGHALQLSERLERHRGKIEAACRELANSIYKLQDIIEGIG